jgi:hypothetical protein
MQCYPLGHLHSRAWRSFLWLRLRGLSLMLGCLW